MQTMPRTVSDLLKGLPSIDKLSILAKEKEYWQGVPRKHFVAVLRKAVETARNEIISGRCKIYDTSVLTERILERAKNLWQQSQLVSLRRVVNATGVLLHTNLGRAPLSDGALKAITDVAQGYSTLEYDLSTGERGERYSHIDSLICRLTGAEDTIVVNNNAAAVLLVLSAFAAGREVIVSRGELVEIGGSFRVPEVMAMSGAKLVEVGTTNKTHLSDYRAAINENTALILKVHTSNYKIIGFTDEVPESELSALAKEHNLPLIKDEGSGNVLPLNINNYKQSTVQEMLKNGCDLVTFSGDKLFGSAQAGIIIGKHEYIEKLKKHQLLRALRIDKLSLAALEGTVRDYLYGDPEKNIAIQRFLRQKGDDLRERAETLADELWSACKKVAGLDVEIEIVETEAFVGGGSLPGVVLPSFGVSVYWLGMSAEKIKARLRTLSIPIIVRVQDGKIVFDVCTLLSGDIKEIAGAYKSCI